MKLTLPPSARLLAAVVFALTPLRADIITMKDGKTKYEGKVIEETADSFKIEYHLTPKIKDTKTIFKTDVLAFKKQTPSEVAFEERGLGKILPTPDLMTAADYETIIQDKLRPFITGFSGTPEAAVVQSIIATLTEEKTKVSNGEIKMEGNFLDAAKAKRDAYNIDAYRLRSEMKVKATQPLDMRYVYALRLFEELRKKYPASLQYVDAIPEAAEIIKLYEAQLTAMIKAQPKLAADRATGIKQLIGGEATLTKNAIKKEEDAYNALVANQWKNKATAWLDIYPYDLKGLQDAQSTVLKEKTELAKIDVEKLHEENLGYMAVIGAIAAANIPAAEAALSRLPKPASGSQPPFVVALGKQIEDLRKTEALVKTHAVKESTVETTAPADPKTVADAVNPMAEAVKKIEEQKKKEKEADRKKKDEEAKQAALAAMNKPPEDEPNFLSQYWTYIAGVLAAVLGGAVYFMKKRKSEDD